MRRVIKDGVLTLAGLAGLLSLLWLAAGALFGLSLIIFQTGSMSPTMPIGTAAIVRPIPAADIAVGDVVTIRREGAPLPVTHRVVSVEVDPQVEGGRLVVMRGDANDVDDQFPYRVTTAELVVFSVPGAGRVLLALRTPLFVGGATLLVTLLVLWAFWPPRPDMLAAHRADPRMKSRTPSGDVPRLSLHDSSR